MVKLKRKIKKRMKKTRGKIAKSPLKSFLLITLFVLLCVYPFVFAVGGSPQKKVYYSGEMVKIDLGGSGIHLIKMISPSGTYLQKTKGSSFYFEAKDAGNYTLEITTDGKKEVFQLNTTEHFSNNCLTSKNKVIGHVLNSQKPPEKFTILFAYEKDGPVSPRVISSVNLLPVDMGGTHVNFFMTS